MGSDDYQPKRLTYKTFLKLYIRSFFLQGTFSQKYCQNEGFAFCMEPVGRILWDDLDKRRTFLMRHMEYYNGNPFMITLVLGAVAKMEEMLLYDNGITENDISRFKKVVGPATGSVGDRFFWGTLRPFGIILGLFTAFYYGFWGLLLLLAVFNIPVFVLRWYWLKIGYRLGTGVISEIQNRRLAGTVQIIEILNAVFLAFLATVHVVRPDSTPSWLSGAAIGLFVLGVFLFRHAVSLFVILLLSLGFAIISGIVVSHIVY